MSQFRFDITNDMAKADEIEILKKLQRIYDDFPDNYLASLFTGEFVGWASNRIRDDVMVDAYEYIQNFYGNPEIDQLKLEVQDKEDILKATKVVLEDKEQTIAKLEQQIETQRTKIINLEDHLHNARNEIGETGNKFSAQAQEILELKAKLYDLVAGK